MFVDLRDFTQLAERRLPYDVVFILNEFFAVVGAAIHAHGGCIDKYLGDGLLAVFGQRHGVEVRLPAGAARGARHRPRARPRQRQAREPRSAGRCASASASTPARSRRPHRLRRGGRPHGGRQRRQRREPARGAGQGEGLPDRDVARGRPYAGRLDAADRVHDLVNVRGVDAPMEVIGILRGRDLPASILALVDDADSALAARGR